MHNTYKYPQESTIQSRMLSVIQVYLKTGYTEDAASEYRMSGYV